MKKKAQSLLDFINVLPLQSIQIIPRSPVTNKEAHALYSIWQSDRDEYGNCIVPEEADPMTVASLTTKGMIKNKPISHVGAGVSPIRTVEITGKGKAIVRNIILANEKSAFEANHNDFDFQYEFLHRSASNQKTASRLEQPRNWLERAIWNRTWHGTNT